MKRVPRELVEAAIRGDYRLVRRMILWDPPLARRWEPIMNACAHGHSPVVSVLLEHGADPNILSPNNWAYRPLHRTVEFRVNKRFTEGHSYIVTLLLQAGADPSIRATSHNLLPAELAAISGLRNAALPRPEDIFFIAASRDRDRAGLRKKAKRLLAGGADPNLNSPYGAPVLYFAIAHARHPEMAELLLAHGAEPDAGVSLVHAACEFHFQHLAESVEWLLNHGAAVNIADSERQQTPLHKAALLDYTRTIRVLLNHGADPTLRDADGQTALDLARRFRKKSAVKALQNLIF